MAREKGTGNLQQEKSGRWTVRIGINGHRISRSARTTDRTKAEAFLNRFLDIYTDPEHSGYADAYRERSMVIGKRLRVINAGETRTAWALDVDRDCRLIVRYDDGTVEHLSSAEVSVAEEK